MPRTWRSAYLDQIGRDVRFAARMLRKAPSFYVLVVGILALGIASAVAFFSLVDGVLLRPLPYRKPERLVMLTSYAPKPPFESNGSISYNDFQQLKAKAALFEDLAVTFRTGWSRVTLTGGREPVVMQGAFVSPDLFDMLGRTPLIGRTFTNEENQHAERVVVISQALWAQRFGSSEAAIGQDLEFGHRRWRVIGVMPQDFQAPFLHTQLWAPVRSHPDWNDAENGNPPDQPRWDVMGRLRPGVSIAAAQAQIDSIENGLKTASPDLHSENVRVEPLREHFTDKVRKPLLILFCAVGCLLLIACANVANLLLARASQRERELAIRTALGAGRAQLLLQLLTEAMAFACGAGVLGAALAAIFVPLLTRLAPAGTPLLDSVKLNERALLFAVLVSASIGLLLGTITAWRLSRGESGDYLKAAGRNATGTRRAARLKNVLVIAEFAIATVLLTAAGLLIHSFIAVLNVNPGFPAEKILTVKIGLPDNMTPPQIAQFYRGALERLAALPGVQAAGGVSNVFFLNETRNHALRQVEGHPPEAKSEWKPLVWTQISGDYFRAMGIPLLRGRFFNERDLPASPPVVIINETLARRYWRGEDAIGKRLKGFDPRGRHDDWLTVVGIVKDTHSGGLEKTPFSQIYEVQAQRGEPIGNFVLRTAGDPAQLAASVRTLIHNTNHNAFVDSISTMEQLLDLQTAARRFQTWLIGVFSALALALAALGIFAILHYSVSARTNEIGVRMALGANPKNIARLVLENGTGLAIAGILIGIVGALGSTRVISGLLYQVRPIDPVSFAGAALTLFAVALAASYLPALRASRIDPIAALREE
jgi:predicted permease